MTDEVKGPAEPGQDGYDTLDVTPEEDCGPCDAPHDKVDEKPPQPEVPRQPEVQRQPEPPEGAKVVRIWRDEEGKTWLNDDGLGPGPTFDLLNWAGITVLMPFFYREMTEQMMRMQQMFHMRVAKAMADHEIKEHGRQMPSPDAPQDTPGSPGGSPPDPSGATSPETETPVGTG